MQQFEPPARCSARERNGTCQCLRRALQHSCRAMPARTLCRRSPACESAAHPAAQRPGWCSDRRRAAWWLQGSTAQCWCRQRGLQCTADTALGGERQAGCQHLDTHRVQQTQPARASNTWAVGEGEGAVRPPCTTTRWVPADPPSAVRDMATDTLMASALAELVLSGSSTMMVDALLAATWRSRHTHVLRQARTQ